MLVLTCEKILATAGYTKSIGNTEIAKLERVTWLIQHYPGKGSRTLFL